MTSSNCVRKTGLLVIAMLLLATTSWAQNRPPIAEKVAKAYGLDSWGQIEQIRYTFNIDIPGLKVSRTWTWEPKADRVTYEGKDKAGNPVKVTYLRSQLSTQPDNVKKEIEPGFVNDQYWLIFPFHAYWDGANVEDLGMHKLPLGKESAELVVLKYAVHHEASCLAITTVVQELLSLGRSRVAAIRILRPGRCPRTIGQ